MVSPLPHEDPADSRNVDVPREEERLPGPPNGATLFESVYAEIHRLARRQMARQPIGHTLQATALVHEAYERLHGSLDRIHTKEHFVRVAARAMRQVLIDHGRRRNAEKRRPAGRRIDLDLALDAALDGAVQSFGARAQGLEELEVALARLEELDPELADVVELRFFGGQTIEACGAILGISERQAYRRWRAARALLAREMGAPEAGRE